MATNEQLKAYIQKLVKEEVAKIAPKLIRETLARSLGQLILEASDLAEIERPSAPAPTTAVRGNSEKRRALAEAVGMEEFPTMGGGTYTTARAGEVTARKVAKAQDNIITIDSAMTENGTPVPLSSVATPEAIDIVTKAMNKNYKGMF